MPSSPTTARRWIAVVPVVLGLLAWFGPLGLRELFDPDEGRYAEIPREMLASGDWLVPRLNDLLYFEKPPLQYWLTAIAYSVLGVGAFSARLWPALAGVLTLGVVFVTARRLGGVLAGVIAAWVLASSLLFVGLAHVLTLDMGVTFFLTLALGALIGALDVRLDARARYVWALAMWASMALAVLSKGLIGVVLPGLALAACLALERNLRVLAHLRWGSGLAVFAAIAVPWFALVAQRHPDFLAFFFVGEHLQRFTAAGHARPGGWYFFVAVLALGTLPWIALQGRGLRDAWRAAPAPGSLLNAPRLLLAWSVTITVFFSLSRSKLPAYVLPVLPAMAVLAGLAAVRAPHAALRGTWAIAAGCGVALLAAIPFVHRLPRMGAVAGDDPLVPWIVTAAAAMIASALLARFALRRDGPRVTVLALGTLVAVQCLLAGAQSISATFTARPLLETAAAAARGFAPGAPFYSVGMFDQTLPLLRGQPVTIVAYRDEFAFGIDHAPHKAIATLEAFHATWQASEQAYAMVPDALLDKPALAGLAYVTLAGNGRERIIARRPSER
jgi:4-amino-4-deoxy-L-arabinose transferase-like glycosyltransferase